MIKKLIVAIHKQIFNDFLSQIKKEQQNIDMSLFEGVFGYENPDKMLQTLV